MILCLSFLISESMLELQYLLHILTSNYKFIVNIFTDEQ